MGWSYRDPMTFPAMYHRIIELAAHQSPEPTLFAEVRTLEELSEKQEHFRWFKWCASHQRSAATLTRRLLEQYDYRCSREVIEGYYLLNIRARPTFLADIINLNREIAEELDEIVNSKI